MKTILTDSEIAEQFYSKENVTPQDFARSIEALVLEKIGDAVAWMCDGQPMNTDGDTPLYAIPFICTERSEVEAQPKGDE